MNAHNGRLVSGGRLQLPSDVHRELGLADRDQVVMRVVDGEVHVRPRRDVLKRIQAMEPDSKDAVPLQSLLTERSALAVMS